MRDFEDGIQSASATRGVPRGVEAWRLRDSPWPAARPELLGPPIHVLGGAERGILIGFDGSDTHGPKTIEREQKAIFDDHTPAQYVAHARSIELLAPSVALLRAVVGMIPPGESDLKPDRNAHQTVVARKDDDQWRVVLFQNTPAAYDGRPELVEALTEELSALI